MDAPWYSRRHKILLQCHSVSIMPSSSLSLSPLTERVARSAFKRPAPKALYHYKSQELAEKIIASKTMWATCVTAQHDLTELTHGIAVAERVAMELIDREPNLFVRRVLACIPEFMRTRREMIFYHLLLRSQKIQISLRDVRGRLL
jgi:hypothetical protein